MTTLAPKPGFDWSRLTWGRPDSPPSALCSYCSAVIPENSVPLIMTDDSGYTVRFCDACMETSFGPRLSAGSRRGDREEVMSAETEGPRISFSDSAPVAIVKMGKLVELAFKALVDAESTMVATRDVIPNEATRMIVDESLRITHEALIAILQSAPRRGGSDEP